jgi:hypothetical protein
MLLCDTKVFPEKYRNIPKSCQLMAETLMNMLLLEFMMIFMWCKLESVVQHFIKCVLMDTDLNMYQDMGGDLLPATVITLISVVVFVCAGIATQYFDVLKKKIMIMRNNIIYFIRPTQNETSEELLRSDTSARLQTASTSSSGCPPAQSCPLEYLCKVPAPLADEQALQEIPTSDRSGCIRKMDCTPVVRRSQSKRRK